MQFHFPHQPMLNLLKQTTLILNSPGVMFHHTVHQFASNCGECLATIILYLQKHMVTCYSNGNYSQLMHDHSCLFTVGTVVCNGIVENISIAVTVPMI